MLIKSIRLEKKKACCGGCAGGKPCCGEKKRPPIPAGQARPHFERRGDLWLPERPLLSRRERRHSHRENLSRLSLPQWPRDRNFLRQVERIMPLRFVRSRHGNALKWRRQFQSVKNLLTLPPDQWAISGLRRWDLPAYMPVIDMSSCPCCSGCCCDIPTTLCVSIEVEAGGPCTNCGDPLSFPPGPLHDFPVHATTNVACPLEPDIWEYQGIDGIEPLIMCAVHTIDVTCAGGTVEFGTSDVNGDGDPSCGGVRMFLDVESCDPFLATGGKDLDLDDTRCSCNGDGETETDHWDVTVGPCPESESS